MVGCLISILDYVHSFLTLNLEPRNFEPVQIAHHFVQKILDILIFKCYKAPNVCISRKKGGEGEGGLFY